MAGEDKITPPPPPQVTVLPVQLPAGAAEAALALERWRGTVDQQLIGLSNAVGEVKTEVRSSLGEVKASITALGEHIATSIKDADRCGRKEHEDFDERLRDLEEDRTRLRTRVAMFAGFAGIIGGGLSSATFNYVFHKLFGG